MKIKRYRADESNIKVLCSCGGEIISMVYTRADNRWEVIHKVPVKGEKHLFSGDDPVIARIQNKWEKKYEYIEVPDDKLVGDPTANGST